MLLDRAGKRRSGCRPNVLQPGAAQTLVKTRTVAGPAASAAGRRQGPPGLILLLAQKPGHVFTREQFISNIQGENIFVTGRTIDTHIAGLRKKIGTASNMIETIRGIGYRFKDAI